MDSARLPARALIDTGVFIRAMGELPKDPRSVDCKDFVNAMAAAGKDVLLAAPSLAEMLRGQAMPAVPNTGAITVVAFDDVAAVELGTKFPAKTLKTVPGGLPATYLKYDAMIAACAIRHRCGFLITLDEKLHPQLPPGLKVAAPGDFRQKQMQLVSVPAAPSSAKKGSGKP
ncbi:MAG: type II toxin-antitoxin system VapC family toxin [Myxococcaceae bacterium]|nr:type II toxin-antitoxin system VapC family toxin [Myxococcaceae bacterium]